MKSIFNEGKAATDEEVSFITRELEELPEHEMALIYFHLWQNFTLKDIALMCDFSELLAQEIFNDAITRLRISYIAEFATKRTPLVNKERSYVA